MKILVETKLENTRLDKFLKENHQIPFPLIQKLIRKKDIKVNGKKTSHNYLLQKGDEISIYNFTLQDKPTKKPNKDLSNSLLSLVRANIIFEDENIIALNKPFDIPVQGGTKIRISISDILPELIQGSAETPKIVHRIDKHTSGLLLLAKTKEIAQILMHCFKEKRVEKHYKALVAGHIKEKTGVLESFISKNTSGDYEKMSSSEEGKEAITKYKVLDEYKNNVSLVEFSPITGRTHQIRVQSSELLSAPILGDRKYGGKKVILDSISNKEKLHLCSTSIKIKDVKGKDYDLTCPMPEHIVQSIKELED